MNLNSNRRHTSRGGNVVVTVSHNPGDIQAQSGVSAPAVYPANIDSLSPQMQQNTSFPPMSPQPQTQQQPQQMPGTRQSTVFTGSYHDGPANPIGPPSPPAPSGPPPVYKQMDGYPQQQQQQPMMPNIQNPHGMPAPPSMAAPGGYAPTVYTSSQPTPANVRATDNHAPYVHLASPQGAPNARGPDVYVMYAPPPAQHGLCPNGQHIYLVKYGVSIVEFYSNSYPMYQVADLRKLSPGVRDHNGCHVSFGGRLCASFSINS